MHRFWSMIANYHGQIYNSSEIGRSLGVSEHTPKRYPDILTNTFIMRQILPKITKPMRIAGEKESPI